MNKDLKITVTFDEYKALEELSNEKINHYACLVAEGGRHEGHWRERYQLWKAIGKAVVSDSEWIDA